VVLLARLELARRGHGLAVEGAEDQAERVEGRQGGADIADRVQRPVPPAALAGDEQDLVLGEAAREGREARPRQAAEQEGAIRDRQRAPEATHAIERLLAR